jgi:hypothetical protein
MKTALVISHADADGHLIAEQVRRNLTGTQAFDVSVVVDPDRTKDHRAWMRLDEFPEISKAEYVFFMDLMFSPANFDDEAHCLVEFVEARPDQKFFLMDHHPLPLRRLAAAKNLRAIYRPDVFECALGPRSGMMVVAAICESQSARVADIRRDEHLKIARGVHRAAAPGGALPGDKLLALLHDDRWEDLSELGEEGKEFHYLPRGRRPLGQAPSPTLKTLETTAKRILSTGGKQKAPRKTRSEDMTYDTQIGQERFVGQAPRRARSNVQASAKDLEAIVTLLEIAALSLTTMPGETFTLDRLIKEAREIGGDEIDLDERDIKIVLEKATFVQRVGKELQLR